MLLHQCQKTNPAPCSHAVLIESELMIWSWQNIKVIFVIRGTRRYLEELNMSCIWFARQTLLDNHLYSHTCFYVHVPFFPIIVQVTSQFTLTPQSLTAWLGTLTNSWPLSVHTAAWCAICLDMTMKEVTTWTRRLVFTTWRSRVWLKRRQRATPLARSLCMTTGWCWKGTAGLQTECFFSHVARMNLIIRQSDLVFSKYFQNTIKCKIWGIFLKWGFCLHDTEYLLIVFLFAFCFVGYCWKTTLQYVRKQKFPFFCIDKRKSDRTQVTVPK